MNRGKPVVKYCFTMDYLGEMSTEYEFERLGHQAELHFPESGVIIGEELLDFCRDGEILVVVSRNDLSGEVIRAARKLKLIVNYGIGVDHIDLKTAAELEIPVINTPDYGVHEVADRAMAFLMALNFKLIEFDKHVKDGNWLPFDYLKPIHSLRFLTLGIVGLGKIGKRMAMKAKSMGMTVQAFDPYVPRWDGEFIGVEMVGSLDELLSQSDFISMHVPLTPETEKIIGEKELQKMKPSAYLINTARGEVLDEAALSDALNMGTIAGAGLDVFAGEPHGMAASFSNELTVSNKVIASPHSAFYTEESIMNMKRIGADEIEYYIKNGCSRFVMDI